MTNEPGTTLPELILLMLLIALLTAFAVPATRNARDQAAVRGARNALAGSVARARMLALSRGSARLSVDVSRDAVDLEAGGSAAEPRRELGAEFGVDIVVDQSSVPVVVLEFDGLGVGRLANRTFRVRRGAAEARLTLSTYGRPRRW